MAWGKVRDGRDKDLRCLLCGLGTADMDLVLATVSRQSSQRDAEGGMNRTQNGLRGGNGSPVAEQF